MIKIVIADDHPVLRQGLKLLFEQEPDFDVVGEAEDGLQTLDLVDRLEPDVLVLDIAMPSMNGIEVAERLCQIKSRTKIVILSMYANEAYLVGALKSHVDSYVLKSETATTLVQVIRDTLAGKRYLSPPLVERTMDAYIDSRMTPQFVNEDVSKLTTREREVMKMVAQGHTNISVASHLGISQRTVETHRSNLMRKLGLSCQAELIRFAIQSGIL